MKLSEVRDNYYFMSGKVSDISRQLGLAGIAIIWVLKHDVDGMPRIPEALHWPLILIVIGLAFDLWHYLAATAIWGGYHRALEKKKVPEEAEFKAPRYANWPSITFFIVKVLSIMAAYVLLLFHLAKTFI